MYKTVDFFIRQGLIVWVEVYRYTLSVWTPMSCRFYPTCSHYAQGALKRHGLWRALGLIFWRLLRCNPFVRGGFDPIP